MTTTQLVFSIDSSPYQEWQAELQAWSYTTRATMPGEVVPLRYTYNEQARTEGLPQYLGGNKPYALKQHSMHGDLADIIIVTDPDCFFQYGFPCVPKPGRPLAQRSLVVYPETEPNATHLRSLGGDPAQMQPIGCIFALCRDDFIQFADAYWEFTRCIWTDTDMWAHFGWMTDMFAALLADQLVGPRFEIMDVAQTNLENRADLPILHTAYENNSTNGVPWRFHKWEVKPWTPFADPPEPDPGIDPATRAFARLYNEYASTR